MSNSNVKRVKTVKYSNMLDRLISVAEYSIFTDGNSRFATLIIYNSSDRLVRSFEMKLDIYDDNKAKIKTKIISINNLSLRPRLFLRLKAKISLPLEAQGFNYLTTSINGSGNGSQSQTSVPIVNKPIIKNNFPSIKTKEDRIIIHPMEVNASKKENIELKSHLKSKSLLLLPVVGLASIALSSIYFFAKLNPVITSTTREKGSGELQIAEQIDFSDSGIVTIEGQDVLQLGKFNDLDERKKLYLDPSVIAPSYSGQIIYISENCFRNTSIERFIVQGPCVIGAAAFAYANKLEYFGCVNYTFKSNNYPGEISGLAANAFFGCTKLTTFKYQSSIITNIPAGTFYGCESLSNYVIPDVTRIDKQAFYKCTSLGKRLFIPSSIDNIGEKSFYESSVKEVTFGNSYTKIEKDSFNVNCTYYGSSLYDENGEEIQNG